MLRKGDLYEEVFICPWRDCLFADLCRMWNESESSSDEIYQRFMEAPDTVLTYLALMGDQTVEWPGEGRGVCGGDDLPWNRFCGCCLV